jgi:divalent metal cation (Fe/Co/Zn/Cd) transporter
MITGRTTAAITARPPLTISPAHDLPSRSPRRAAHRRAAYQAVAASAVDLGITGGVDPVLAVLTGSVGLLGDALHNLSDVSTSAVVFVGFRVSKRRPTSRSPTRR